jgi:pilus assembly protein Flp/PilA
MKNISRMVRTKDLVRSLLADRKGVTAIEYGLIAGIIAVGIVTVLGAVSNNLIGLFQTIAGALTSAA